MKTRKKRLLKGTGKNTKFPRNTKGFNDEDAPSKMGIKQPHRKANQWDSPFAYADHTKIRRLLKKHVGRPWNSVWQEICSLHDPRSFEGHEIRTWMEFAVERNCMINEDGLVVNEYGYEIANWRDGYYVHPESGILCQTPQRPRWKRQKIEQKVFEMDGNLYLEHDEVWYRVKMRELCSVEKTRYTRDQKGRSVAFYTYTEYVNPYGDDVFGGIPWNENVTSVVSGRYGLSPEKKYWYCYFKESANGKEISKLKKTYNLDDESRAA